MTREEQAGLPATVLTPEQIADAVTVLLEDDAFVGRVLVWWSGEDWHILEADATE
jgi:hypothetical protein